MTADVLPLGRNSRTLEEENVRKSIRALLAWNDMTPEDLAERAGMSVTTIYKRLTLKPGPGKSWLLRDVVAIARVFDVSVDQLVDGTAVALPGSAETSTTNRYRKGRAA